MISFQINNNINIINKQSLPLIPQLELLNNNYPTGQPLVYKSQSGWKDKIDMTLIWQRPVNITMTIQQWDLEILNPYIVEWIEKVSKKYRIDSKTILKNLFLENNTFYYYIEFLYFLFDTAVKTQNTLNNATYWDEEAEREKNKYDKMQMKVHFAYNLGFRFNEIIIQIIKNGKLGSSFFNSIKSKINWQSIKIEKPEEIKNDLVFIYGTYKIDLYGDYNLNLANKKIYFLKNRYYQEDIWEYEEN